MYLRLRVAGECYALPVERVREVARDGAVTPVPGSPAGLLGVRSLRGQIVGVLDLASALGSRRPDPPRFVVVVTSGDGLGALAVDEVAGVETLSGIEPSDDHPLLTGKAVAGDELVGVIDVDALFGHDSPAA